MKIQAIKRGQRDRADLAGKRSSEASGPLRLLQACTAPLQKCTAGIRAMLEGVQDGSSGIFGQSKAVSEHGVLSEQGLNHAMPKGGSQLPPALEAQLRKLFGKMDRDRDQILSKAEAVEYWGKNFAKINAQAMFNEVTAAIVSASIVSSAEGHVHVQRSERRPHGHDDTLGCNPA